MRLVSALILVNTALAAAMTATPAAAQIRIYCCDDAKGRKVCSDYLPPECQGRAYEERDSQGRVSKQVEAPLTAEQQARRAAELAKKEEDKKKASEERRRTLALMSTYSNEKDIDNARDRALRELENQLKQAQARLEEANKKKKKTDNEKEFYKGKPLPDQVKAQIADAEKEIKAQSDAVAAKTKEMEDVRVKFAEEKKRFLELTGKKPAEGAAAPAGATPAAAPAPAAKADEKPAAPAPAPAPKPADKK